MCATSCEDPWRGLRGGLLWSSRIAYGAALCGVAGGSGCQCDTAKVTSSTTMMLTDAAGGVAMVTAPAAELFAARRTEGNVDIAEPKVEERAVPGKEDGEGRTPELALAKRRLLVDSSSEGNASPGVLTGEVPGYSMCALG